MERGFDLAWMTMGITYLEGRHSDGVGGHTTSRKRIITKPMLYLWSDCGYHGITQKLLSLASGSVISLNLELSMPIAIHSISI